MEFSYIVFFSWGSYNISHLNPLLCVVPADNHSHAGKTSHPEDVGEVKWIGLETAKRLHRDEEGVIFIDVRDRRDYVAGHIADAYCTPLPEIIAAWWEISVEPSRCVRTMAVLIGFVDLGRSHVAFPGS